AITLIEEDGVLRWEDRPVLVSAGGRRFGRAGTAIISGRVVRQYNFEKLEPNQVGGMLVTLDEKLTPNQGLHRVRLVNAGGGEKKAVLEKIEKPTATKRALVLIHGTFSNAENTLGELQASATGKKLLSDLLDGANKKYDAVFAFNHPTLSLSPVINALDLARLFGDCPATVDVICHSRGGLVTRWWLEGLNHGRITPGKVVAVASPLGGTSLAAPPRLRAALNFITNVGRALEVAGTAVGTVAGVGAPFMTVAVGLVRVITTITGVASNVPLIDAAVAMIPGLAGQSRVNNNLELSRILRQGSGTLPEYNSIIGNFEPPPVGWKFWKLFVKPKERAFDLGADMVFDQDNDLVVDTRSMTELFKDGDNVLTRIERVFDFGTRNDVHHTNYFRQPETVKFIRESLNIG
ncbi:MAG: hypothetical protein M3X11_08080, partial [Acidobacteriota bacterium]|nr:hypothetical protein [Acidobacteriota bacterium]